MRTVNSIADIRGAVRAARNAGARVALVPTMGALHEGHLALIDRAKVAADFVVASVFVNPLQFGPSEDFERYPRDLNADGLQLATRGTHMLFAPSREEIYPAEQHVSVQPGPIASEWEGAVRPSHFAGVLTVVAKLFNIVLPDVAIFGQKDLQQVALVDMMIRELNFPVSLMISPTVRAPDGLALSSRNAYLSAEERERAPRLHAALDEVRRAYEAGEQSSDELEKIGRSMIESTPEFSLDYFAVIDRKTFVRVERAGQTSAAILAARIGRTRLIDNVLFGEHA